MTSRTQKIETAIKSIIGNKPNKIKEQVKSIIESEPSFNSSLNGIYKKYNEWIQIITEEAVSDNYSFINYNQKAVNISKWIEQLAMVINSFMNQYKLILNK